MIAENVVDVGFPLTGSSLPLDHGYALYGALCRLLPVLHAEHRESRDGGSPSAAWGVHPVRGLRSGPGLLAIDRSSLLKVRLPASRIAELLPLAGKTLELDGHRVAIGVPRIFALESRAALRARFVTIKHHEGEPAEFALATRQQLARIPGLGIDPERIAIEVGGRRVMRVSDKKVVGFQVAIDGLDATASLAVQVQGLGGRRHMGAGVCVPWGRKA